MKTKIFNPAIYGLLICLTTSFILSPATEKNKVSTGLIKKETNLCFVQFGMSGLPTGVTVSGLKAVSGATTVNFTTAGGGVWSHTAFSGSWLIYVQVTGTFGSLDMDQCCMPGGSGGPTWYLACDGFIALDQCFDDKINFYTSSNCQ